MESIAYCTVITRLLVSCVPLEWLSNDCLLLGGFSAERGEYIQYQLTISTGELVPTSSVTPSP